MRRICSRVTLPAVLLASIAGSNQTAIAQENPAAPRAVAQSRPQNPLNAAGVPVEGWALVRYSVRSDGSTDNVRVLEMVPPSADPKDTVSAVEEWSFVPASLEGEPLDWHNNESVVMSGRLGDEPQSADAFADAYAAVGNLIEEQQYDAALEANAALVNEIAVRAEDFGLALAQGAIIRIGLADFHGALRFIQLATNPSLDALRGEDLLVGLQLRLQVEAQLRRTRDAIRTLERIAAGVGPEETNPFAQMAEDLRSNWNDVEILQVVARVDDRPWRIDAGRRIFSIDQVEGQLDSIDAECDRRRITLEFQPNVEWQLPDSFGECTLFVNGAEGTTFSFFELLPAE